jgi:hypothetical protein
MNGICNTHGKVKNECRILAGKLWVQIRWPWWSVLCTATTNPSIWEFIIQILPYNLTEMRRRSVMLLIHLSSGLGEGHSLGVLAVYLAKCLRKYLLPDFTGKCTEQSAGHQRHHTTRLRKSDAGSCFQQLHEDYHDPINGGFLYCWFHRG